MISGPLQTCRPVIHCPAMSPGSTECQGMRRTAESALAGTPASPPRRGFDQRGANDLRPQSPNVFFNGLNGRPGRASRRNCAISRSSCVRTSKSPQISRKLRSSPRMSFFLASIRSSSSSPTRMGIRPGSRVRITALRVRCYENPCRRATLDGRRGRKPPRGPQPGPVVVVTCLGHAANIGLMPITAASVWAQSVHWSSGPARNRVRPGRRSRDPAVRTGPAAPSGTSAAARRGGTGPVPGGGRSAGRPNACRP